MKLLIVKVDFILSCLSLVLMVSFICAMNEELMVNSLMELLVGWRFLDYYCYNCFMFISCIHLMSYLFLNCHILGYQQKSSNLYDFNLELLFTFTLIYQLYLRNSLKKYSHTHLHYSF